MTGADLRRRRIEKGLTQRQLGEALGFSGDPGRSVRKIEAKGIIAARDAAFYASIIEGV